jgi:hypothetical protein
VRESATSSARSGYGHVAGSGDVGNGDSGSSKGAQYHDHLLNKDTAPRNAVPGGGYN